MSSEGFSLAPRFETVVETTAYGAAVGPVKGVLVALSAAVVSRTGRLLVETGAAGSDHVSR